MADTDQRTVASITRKGCGPQVHAYNDPSLSATEFLRAVYCDPTLPMSIRIDAARGLLPYTEPPPGPRPTNSFPPRCTIVIGGLGPYDQGLSPEDPEQIVSETQSFSPSASNNPQPQSESPGPSYIEKILERMSLDEIIKTVANTPEHLLPICTICNHPMMYPCSVAPQAREALVAHLCDQVAPRKRTPTEIQPAMRRYRWT